MSATTTNETEPQKYGPATREASEKRFADLDGALRAAVGL